MTDDVEDRAVIILNSSEAGTPAYDLAVAALAIRGAQRCMQLCSYVEDRGGTHVSIEWLRATFDTLVSADKAAKEARTADTGAESAENAPNGTVSDGYQEFTKCERGQWCGLEVVRIGKVQCWCDTEDRERFKCPRGHYVEPCYECGEPSQCGELTCVQHTT